MGPLDVLEEGRASLIIIPWIKNIESLESIHFMEVSFVSVISAQSPLLTKYDVVPKDISGNSQDLKTARIPNTIFKQVQQLSSWVTFWTKISLCVLITPIIRH